MPDAGWYDDPLVPGGKRYWDGAAWTDSAQAPPPGPGGGIPPAALPPGTGGPPMSGPPLGGTSIGGSPPFETLPVGASATGHARSKSGLADLGDWLSQTFRGVMDNALGLLMLFFVIPIVFFAVAYLAFQQSFADVLWVDGNGLSGYNTGLAFVAALGFIAFLIAGTLGTVAGHHLLYASHVGQPTQWPASAAAGLKRLPRAIGISLVVALAFLLAAAIPTGLFTLAAVSDGGAIGLLVLLGFLASIAAAAVFVWLWVKVGFVWVAAAVVPSGTSALGSSFRLSSGRFWAVFARLGIVAAMAWMLSAVTQALAQFIAPVLLFSKFDFGTQGELLLDGRDIATLDQVRLGDVMPNPVAALIYFSMFVLVAVVAQALVASGTAALYADAGAPNNLGHTGGTAGGHGELAGGSGGFDGPGGFGNPGGFGGPPDSTL